VITLRFVEHSFILTKT